MTLRTTAVGRATRVSGTRASARSTATGRLSVVPAVPIAPSNLSGVATSTTNIDLTWTNNDVATSTSQTLRRALDSAFTLGVTDFSLSGSATGYSDGSLAPLTQYYYKIKATGVGGDSSYSAQIAAATSADYYVDNTNPSATDGGSGTALIPFLTIQHAANVAIAGKSVLVVAGTYTETVTFPSSGTSGHPIRFVAADGVSIGGTVNSFIATSKNWLNIENFLVTGTSQYGIKLTSCTNIVVDSNEVTLTGVGTLGNTFSGIFLSLCTSCTVSNNIVHECTDDGIHLVTGSNNNLVFGNVCYSNARVYVRAAAGIGIVGSGNSVYQNNCYSNEDSGINGYAGSNSCLYYNNVCQGNGDHGIDVHGATGCLVYYNTIYNNTNDGINVESNATGTTVIGNLSVDNGGSAKSNIKIDSTSTTSTTVDYNLVFKSDPTSVTLNWLSVTYKTMAAFATASNQMMHGVEATPVFASIVIPDLRLQAASAAHLAGLPESIGGVDHDGVARPATGNYDIGAYQGSFDPVRPPGRFTNAKLIVTEPTTTKPAYLVSAIDPTFGTPLVRITGNPGGGITNIGSGTWGSISEHVYSSQQAWSKNRKWLLIQNPGAGGGIPTKLLLNGLTYAPVKSATFLPSGGDFRWHDSDPDLIMSIDYPGTNLKIINVSTQATISTQVLPSTVYGFAQGGNPSKNSRYVVVTDNDGSSTSASSKIYMVDTVNMTTGPTYDLTTNGYWTSGWWVGYGTVSPSGAYAVIKFGGGASDTFIQVFDINPSTLVLTPHVYSSSVPVGGGNPATGFIWGLKHADVGWDSDGVTDVIAGGCGPPSTIGTIVPGISLVAGAKGVGHVVKVRLSDGQTVSLTDPASEPSFSHASLRCFGRPGWMYCSFYPVAGKRFNDEIIALKLDGSQSVERLAHTHSDFTGTPGYQAEPHPCISEDALALIFGSNWYILGNGVKTEVQDYVLDLS